MKALSLIGSALRGRPEPRLSPCRPGGPGRPSPDVPGLLWGLWSDSTKWRLMGRVPGEQGPARP